MVHKERKTRIPWRHIACFYSICYLLQSLCLFSVMINNNSLLREHFIRDQAFADTGITSDTHSNIMWEAAHLKK